MDKLQKSVCLRGTWRINSKLFFPFYTVAMEMRTDMPRNTKSVRHRSSKPPGHFPCKSKQSYFEKLLAPAFVQSSSSVVLNRYSALSFGRENFKRNIGEWRSNTCVEYFARVWLRRSMEDGSVSFAINQVQNKYFVLK